MRRRRLGQNLSIDIGPNNNKNNTYRLNLYNITRYFRLAEVVGRGFMGRGVEGRGGCGSRGSGLRVESRGLWVEG